MIAKATGKQYLLAKFTNLPKDEVMSKNIFLFALLSLAFGFEVFSAVVTDEDENWHNLGKTAKHRMAYEWFYFDMRNADGSSLVVAFLGPNPYDVTKSTLVSPKGIRNYIGVLAQAVDANGKRWEVLNFTRKNNVSFTAKPFRLKMNESVLTMERMGNGLREYTMSLDAVDTKTGMRIKANLRLEALMEGWKHKEGYVYSDGKANPKDYHKWFVTVPKGEVNGSFTYTAPNGETSGTIKFDRASGYHDHNYGTLPIADTTDGWYWGRAEVNDKVIIYSKVFGKSKPAFLGDMTYRKNPEWNIMFVGTEEKVLVDTDEMKLEDFGSQNKTVLANGMVVPKSYRMVAPGLDSELFQVDVSPTKPIATSVPYYSRQDGTISLKQARTAEELPMARPETSETVIAEQIDYPRYMQIVLGLPKPFSF